MADHEPKYIRFSDILNSSSGSESSEILQPEEPFSPSINRLQSERKVYESYFQIEDGDGGSPDRTDRIQTPQLRERQPSTRKGNLLVVPDLTLEELHLLEQ